MRAKRFIFKFQQQLPNPLFFLNICLTNYISIRYCFFNHLVTLNDNVACIIIYYCLVLHFKWQCNFSVVLLDNKTKW